MAHANPLNQLYHDLFAGHRYAQHPDMEFRYQWALQCLSRHPILSVVDVGAGRGVLTRLIQEHFPDVAVSTADLGKFHTLDVPHQNVDIVATPEAFVNAADALVFCDVLEHLPVLTIERLLASRPTKFILGTVAWHSDVWKGQELHLTRQLPPWWHAQFSQHYTMLQTELVYTPRPDALSTPTLSSKHTYAFCAMRNQL